MLSEKIKGEITKLRENIPLLELGDRNIFLGNLVFCHDLMTSSHQLLLTAAQNSKGKLRDYYLAHAEEEQNHDEWVRNDLASGGVFLCPTYQLPLAIEIIDKQYSLIKHTSANCLLGYMAVLEGFPMESDLLKKLEEIHGKELLRTLRHHSEEDIKHAQDLWEIIDFVNDELILENAIQTTHYCGQIAAQLLRNHHVHDART